MTEVEAVDTQIQQEVPQQLEDGDLRVNRTKTENYEIPKPPPPLPPPPTMEELQLHQNDKPLWSALDWIINYTPEPPEDKTPDWAKCKLLGSYLNTKSDIVNRKNATLQAVQKFEKTFNSKIISNIVKIRTFNIYIASVFLYNSELWGLSKTDETEIDSFHRRVLRLALGVKWPRKLSNNKLLEITKAEPWSKVIQRRRFTFIGHVMRLHSDTPVRKALHICLQPSKNKIGRPTVTWLRTIKRDLEKCNVIIKLNNPYTETTLENLASDRLKWNELKKMLMQ